MLLIVTVKPGSKKPGIEKQDEDHWTVRLRERAVEGRANAALIQAVAAELGVAPSRVRFVRGEKSRTKTLEIV